MTYTTSPLRYPGGKGKIAECIFNLLPTNTHTICSPFLGGGGVELYLGKKGIQVYGYDIFEPLIDFWQVLLHDTGSLSQTIKSYYPMSKNLFSQLKSEFKITDCKTKRASIFYILNRASFSGLTFSGGFSPGMARFTQEGIQALASFKAENLSVKNEDFKTSIRKHDSDFLFLDPPYFSVKNLYGKWGSTHNKFDHEALATILKVRGNWIMTYDDCEFVRKLYDGYKFIKLRCAPRTSEVLIMSKDLSFKF